MGSSPPRQNIRAKNWPGYPSAAQSSPTHDLFTSSAAVPTARSTFRRGMGMSTRSTPPRLMLGSLRRRCRALLAAVVNGPSTSAAWDSLSLRDRCRDRRGSGHSGGEEMSSITVGSSRRPVSMGRLHRLPGRVCVRTDPNRTQEMGLPDKKVMGDRTPASATRRLCGTSDSARSCARREDGPSEVQFDAKAYMSRPRAGG